MSKTNVYVVVDKVADETVLLGMCKTDGLLVRQNLPYLSKINPNFANDFIIYCIGQYVDTSMSLEPCPAREVPWDSYKTPEAFGSITSSENHIVKK